MHPGITESRILLHFPFLSHFTLDIVTELGEGSNPLHFFRFDIESEVLLHDYHNIYEVEAVYA